MTTKIPFTFEFDYQYGAIQQLSPTIRRIIAHNPSPFTFRGTGTYIIGQGKVAVIDPGPLREDHLKALTEALKGETVTHILITHTHNDHSPAAKPFKEITGAPTYGYGPHGSGKHGSAKEGDPMEAGADRDFVPDHEVRHGQIIKGDGWTIECVYTPGHTSNHMCYQLAEEKALFTGDHVMGWSTSVIGPPDGDMTSYMESLAILLERDDEIYWPTHGTCIKDTKAYVQSFIDHRVERENQILACMKQGISQIEKMVPVIYTETDENMYPAAARSVLAAIYRLTDSGKVKCEGKPSIKADFTLN